MNKFLTLRRGAKSDTGNESERPEGLRAVQVILFVVLCFHVIAFYTPQSQAAVATNGSTDEFGIQHAGGYTKGEDILFRGGMLAFKAGDFEQARNIWEYTARLGSAPSQYLLANLYQHGWGVERELSLAFTYHVRAALQGVPAAEFQLGLTFFQLGAMADAMHWWNEAANAGFSAAQYNLGLVHLYGLGVDKDQKQARHWLMQAAKHGSARAQFYIGVIYLKGKGVAQDRAHAQQWFDKAADNGYAGARVDIDTLASAPVTPVLAQ